MAHLHSARTDAWLDITDAALPIRQAADVVFENNPFMFTHNKALVHRLMLTLKIWHTDPDKVYGPGEKCYIFSNKIREGKIVAKFDESDLYVVKSHGKNFRLHSTEIVSEEKKENIERWMTVYK